jgi:hypothetical protein
VLAVGQSIMTFSELQTVMFEVANLLNERPIGTKETDPNEGSYFFLQKVFITCCTNFHRFLKFSASSHWPIGTFEDALPRIRSLGHK